MTATIATLANVIFMFELSLCGCRKACRGGRVAIARRHVNRLMRWELRVNATIPKSRAPFQDMVLTKSNQRRAQTKKGGFGKPPFEYDAALRVAPFRTRQ